jgi:hypothetical protein
VQELVRSGEAKQLLAGTDVGPTWYDGQWWYVPSDAADDADYLVADAELAAEFDRLRVRVEHIDNVSGASE